MDDKLWSLGTAGAVLLGGILAKKISAAAWKKATKIHKPEGLKGTTVGWGRVFVYTALSGVLVQLMCRVVHRQSTPYLY